MESRTNRLAGLTVRILPGVVLITAAGVFFLDDPLALAVEQIVRRDSPLGRYTSDIPDLLLQFVLGLTTFFFVARRMRIRTRGEDYLSDFYRLGALVLPISFLAKTGLKLLFGRIETRMWLQEPVPPAFQWFRPGEGHSGFPSGHMMVFAALAAACWLFFPRIEKWGISLLLLLGTALVATNYHFLADVMAGGYLGVAVTAVTAFLLEKTEPGRMP